MSDKIRQMAEANKILEIRHGSHLYGTSTENSDEDFVGIFMPSREYIFGLKSIKEVDFSIVDKDSSGKNTKEAVDKKLYEFRKFVNLALGGNPNILEVLFVNDSNLLFNNPLGDLLLSCKQDFPSRLCIPKFVGYAHSQKHKMIIKKDNYEGLQCGVKVLKAYSDKTTMGQVYDAQKDNPIPLFIKKGTGVHIHIGNICFEPGVYVKKARKMLEERINKATNRSELILKHGFDSKFGAHLIRLLKECLDLINTGELIFPLAYADELLDIRQGNWKLEEVIKYAEDLEDKLNKAKLNTCLPAKPAFHKVEEMVMSSIEDFMKI